eukprot:3325365-Pyramimonas_sp.AAC.1
MSSSPAAGPASQAGPIGMGGDTLIHDWSAFVLPSAGRQQSWASPPSTWSLPGWRWPPSSGGRAKPRWRRLARPSARRLASRRPQVVPEATP